MLGPEHEGLILDLAGGKISETEFFERFPWGVEGHPELVTEFLESARAAKSREELNRALLVSYRLDYQPGKTRMLCSLLSEDWHPYHEDIVLELQRLRDPAAIETLYMVAENFPKSLAWDDNYAFSRKCTWALYAIGTPEAFERLRLLGHSSVEQIRKFAIERLVDAGEPGEFLSAEAGEVMRALGQFSFADIVRREFAGVVERHTLKEVKPAWRGPEGRAVAYTDGTRWIEFVIEYPSGFIGARLSYDFTPPGGAQRSTLINWRLESEGAKLPRGPENLFKTGKIDEVVGLVIGWILRHEEELFHED